MADLAQRIFKAGIRKPARYVGGEYFTVPPRPPKPQELRVALVFPDVYEVGMSNHGLMLLYSLLRARPGIFVDRFFAPWTDMEEAIRGGVLPLVSRDLGLELKDFHVLGFSMAYELTYTNILNILDLGGIPVRACQRNESHPLVLGGGPGSIHPEPMAPFFDGFLIGDGEVLLPPALDLLRSLMLDSKQSRSGILEQLSALEGSYIPALRETLTDPQTGFQIVQGDRVRRRWCPDLTTRPDVTLFPVPSTEAVFDRISMEITRGCTQGCRFCEAGYFYRPLRERPLQDLLNEAGTRMAATGMEEVGLSSLSTADRSDLDVLVTRLRPTLDRANVGLSLSSLRAYGVADSVLEAMTDGRTSSLTLAPESCARLRKVINKSVTDQDLFEAVHRMAEAGLERVKLYFMLGLPGETEDDVREIARLAEDVQKIGRAHRGRRFVTVVSCSLFVPRPNTPFQWAPMLGEEELKQRVELLKFSLPRFIEMKWHDTSTSRLEAILARGDRRVGDMIERAWQLGTRLDGWSDVFRERAWLQAQAEVFPEAEVFLGELPMDAPLPWDHIDSGVRKAFFRKEWEAAMDSRMTPACAPEASPQLCHGCGLPCLSMQRAEQEQEAWVAPEPTPVWSEGDLVRIRFRFRRLSPATVLGSLDLMRTITRGFKRTGLPFIYSSGFHPRMKISMAPSLALGHLGLDEWVDAWLPRPHVEHSSLLELVASRMIPGVEFFSAEEAPQAMGNPTSIEFVLGLDRELPGDLELDALKDSWTRDGFFAERKGRNKDVSAGIFSISGKLPEDLSPDLLPGAGYIHLVLSPSSAPRPEELAEAMGLGSAVISVTRTKFNF